MSTTAQITANQKNAELSTGPTSIDGKAKSSLNARDEAAVLSEPKTQIVAGLTGRTVLLPGDDAAAYEAHIASFLERHQPAGDEERNLVQSLADTEWRLMRIPALEFGIYAVGRLEFAGLFAQEDPAVRNQLIEAKIFLAYQRQLNNLSIQENRLRRHRDKDMAALRDRQEPRKRDEKIQLHKAAVQYIRAVREHRHDTWDPSANGFEFSLEQIELRALEIHPDLFAAWAAENAA